MSEQNSGKYKLIKENKLFFVLLFSLIGIDSLLLFIPNPSEVTLKKLSAQREKLDQVEVDTKAIDYGMVFLISDHQGETYEKSFGHASRNQKMTTDKIFNIASTTKTFTAVLIFQEIERGKLKLDDPIGKFYNPVSLIQQNIDPDITIKELLSHKSGLGRIHYSDDCSYCFKIFDYYPDKFQKTRGEFNYSNTNYRMLGEILGRINKKPFEEVLKERILKPYNLKNTFAYYSKSIPNIAHPMVKGKDLLNDIDNSNFNKAMEASANISSNIEDLNTFFRHLYAGDYFKHKKTLELMTDFDEDTDFGLGLHFTVGHKVENDKIYYYGHNGDNSGFTSRNYYNPQTKELLIVLANESQENDTITHELILDLLGIMSN